MAIKKFWTKIFEIIQECRRHILEFEIFIWVGVGLSLFISLVCLIVAPCICFYAVCSFIVGISTIIAGNGIFEIAQRLHVLKALTSEAVEALFKNFQAFFRLRRAFGTQQKQNEGTRLQSTIWLEIHIYDTKQYVANRFVNTLYFRKALFHGRSIWLRLAAYCNSQQHAFTSA